MGMFISFRIYHQLEFNQRTRWVPVHSDVSARTCSQLEVDTLQRFDLRQIQGAESLVSEWSDAVGPRQVVHALLAITKQASFDSQRAVTLSSS